MYHGNISFRTLGLTALVAVVAGVGPARAADPLTKCRAGIAKATSKYEQSRAKIMNKCDAAVVKGDITGPCPDTATSAALSDVAAKLAATIAKSCCGEDKICGNSDDITTPAALGYGTLCADAADGSDCSTITLADLSTLDECIACNAGGNADGVLATAYDSRVSTTDADLIKCQLEIGAKAAKLYGAASKEVSKCRAKDLGGGSCTGASDAYLGSKSVAKIAKAEQKAIDSIVGKCTAYSAAQIGLPTSCPTIVSQGAGDSCTDAAISDVNDYLSCITCVAERSIVCPECRYCGNGVTDFALGETCDDGNVADGDACPSDCRAAACTLATNGFSSLVDVSFTAPEGMSVAGLTVFVHYPENNVLMSGSGNVGTGGNTPIPTVAAGIDLTPNDTDYGLRAVILSQSLSAITPGSLFTMELRHCEGKTLSDKQLACVVIDAADPDLNPVAGVTCTAVQL